MRKQAFLTPEDNSDWESVSGQQFLDKVALLEKAQEEKGISGRALSVRCVKKRASGMNSGPAPAGSGRGGTASVEQQKTD